MGCFVLGCWLSGCLACLLACLLDKLIMSQINGKVPLAPYLRALPSLLRLSLWTACWLSQLRNGQPVAATALCFVLDSLTLEALKADH